ncbi:MAG: glycosyltransferase family 2 protein [Oscillospiraceae bacterium]|nr:glycosyltransferase family 2 protein [Oscillospiraceae bacterium]MDD4414322.1 glycosyltransferase family 2 protein [Oscillospiraceae bacterium]
MNEGIEVSVIVPVYNVEMYLDRCLNSLVNQTLKNIEIIIVNDGSSDNSQNIIDGFMLYDRNIISITKVNSGLSDARNVGIEKASGEYIGFVDSDDYIDHTMFEKLYSKASDENADIVVCGYYGINDETKRVKVCQTGDMTYYDKSLFQEPSLLYINEPFACNKLFRRSLFICSGIRFPSGLIFEDIPTVYSLFTKAKTISKVDEPLYYYIQKREGAITSGPISRQVQILDSLSALNMFYSRNNYYHTFRRQLLFINLKHIILRFKVCENRKVSIVAIKFVFRAFKHLNTHFPDWKTIDFTFKFNIGYKNKELKGRHKTALYWVVRILFTRYIKRIYRLFKNKA